MSQIPLAGRRLLAFAALLAVSSAVAAQPRPLGVGVKVAAVPQVGLDLRFSETLGVRLLTSLSVGNDDASGVTTVAVPLHFRPVGRTTVYVGPSLTVINYEDLAFAGGLIGVEYEVGRRVGLFGEIAVDVGVDESYLDVSTGINTGLGAFYRF